jgi:hypothetical protein
MFADMKVSMILLGLFAWSCQASFTNTDSAQDMKMKKDTIVRPAHVSPQAKLINLGFVDAPSYVWIEYVGFYKDTQGVHSHIFGIEHTNIYPDDYPEQVDTLYYEFDGSRRQLSVFRDLKDYEIIPYPGNGTYKLINKDDYLLLFNVMQLSDSRQIIKGKEWQMAVPTTEINRHGEKVSGVQAHVHIEKENGDIYLVSLIDDKGMRTLHFQKRGDCSIDSKISYLDKQEGRLYFVPKDCYLEILEKGDLSKL